MHCLHGFVGRLIMPKNDLISRMRASFDRGVLTGIDLGYQRAFDYWMIALNDPDIMGAKNVIGGQKIRNIAKEAQAQDKNYCEAWETKGNAEADYYQEMLDARLRKILGEEFVPFGERYSMIEKCKY